MSYLFIYSYIVCDLVKAHIKIVVIFDFCCGGGGIGCVEKHAFKFYTR